MTSSELADLLERAATDMVRRAESVLGEAPQRSARLSQLVGSLISSLREPGRELAKVESAAATVESAAATEDALAEHDVVHDLAFELAEASGLAIGARELRLVSAWRQAAHARSRKALAEHTRRLSMLLDSVEETMVLHEAEDDGVFLHFNRAASKKIQDISDRSAESLLGTRVRDFLSLPIKQRQLFFELREARAGRAVASEVFLRTPEGGRWRENRVTPVFDAEGQVEAAALISRDITTRKLAETRLKLLAKLSTLAEAQNEDGVLAAFARIAVPELADLCVVDLVEPNGIRRSQVLFHDPTRAALADALRTVCTTELYDTDVGRALLAGRSQLVTELDTNVSLRCGGSLSEVTRELAPRSLIVVPLRVFGVTIAVAAFIVTADSERRYGQDDLEIAEELASRAAILLENTRLHSQLRERDARLQIALAGSNVCIFEQDADLRLKWIYNWLLDSADLPLSPALLNDKRRALLSGSPTRSELPIRMRGEDRHLIVTHVPVRGAAGEVVGLIGTVVDITDEKRIQGQLSHALTFRDQVMGILGHDLRNPLSAVLGAVGLARMRREPVSPAVSRDLDHIENATRRMLELIATLLDFSEARFTDQLPISPAASDLHEICARVVGELRLGRPDRLIELEVRGDTRGVWDAPRLAQVVSNLLGNALQHGDPQVPARMIVEGDSEGVRLEVHNRGTPISPEHLPLLFEPFWRPKRDGRESRARSRGLGLGLYIAQQIVRAHEGNISVRSSAEAGTSFSVHLPRQQRNAPRRSPELANGAISA